MQPRFSELHGVEREFMFSGRPRVFAAVEALPFRWPTKAADANSYIEGWKEIAEEMLAKSRLSKDTMRCIASHMSRRDGACRLTDKALSARSGRALRSTKRDVYRLKMLGLVFVEYEAGDGQQERVRILKIAVPVPQRSGQRIPQHSAPEVGPTYPPYVGPLDIGERRDV